QRTDAAPDPISPRGAPGSLSRERRGEPGGAARGGHRRWGRGLGVEELGVEVEHRPAGGAGTGLTVLPLASLCPAPQASLAAHLHLLHALGPAGDDLVQLELERLVPLVAGVELGPVGELARVVDRHLVGGLGSGTGALLLRDVDDARRQDLRTLLL